MKLKSEHKKWADFVIKGMTEIDAYLEMCPKSTRKNASNMVGTYRKNQDLMDYVAKGLAKISAIVQEKVTDKLSDAVIGNVLTSAKKREILNLIALGEIEYEKLVLVEVDDLDDKGKKRGKKRVYKKMLVKPDLHERIKAIDLDNKMTGDVFRAKPHELAGDEDGAELGDLFKNTTFVFRSVNEIKQDESKPIETKKKK